MFRKYFSQYTVNAHLAGNSLGGTLIVSGKHNRFNTHPVYLFQRLFGVGLKGIRHSDDSYYLTIQSKEHHRPALCPELVGFLLQSIQAKSSIFHQSEVTQKKLLPVH